MYEIDDVVMEMVSGLPLVSLNIAFSNVTDRGLAMLAGCRGLKQLCLSGCKFVSVAGLRALVASCSELKCLEIDDCSGVFDASVAPADQVPSRFLPAFCERLIVAGFDADDNWDFTRENGYPFMP